MSASRRLAVPPPLLLAAELLSARRGGGDTGAGSSTGASSGGSAATTTTASPGSDPAGDGYDGTHTPPFPANTQLDTGEPSAGAAGITEYDGSQPHRPHETDEVTEVVWISTFEGTSVALVGTTARTPFRVYLLEQPARVVLDVVHHD